MLVVDDVRNHHVAHVRVQRGGLAEDVEASHPRGLFGDLPKDVIRGLAKGVVDVDDAGVRRAQLFFVDRTHARIDCARVELREHENLCRGVDACSLGRYVPDPVPRFHLGSPPPHPLAIRVMVEDLPRAVVHPVMA